MSPDRYPRLAVVALATFVFVAFGVELYAMSVLLTKEAAGGDFSIGLLSAGFGGSGIVAGLLAPRVGRWADHHSVRGIMAVGAVLAFAGMTSLAMATEPWMVLVAFWTLLGPAQAMTLYEPAFVAVSLWVGSNVRNKAFALLTLIGGVAGPIFLPITGLAVKEFGWRPTVLGLGASVLVTGLVVTVFLYPKEKPSTDRRAGVPQVSFAQFFRDRRLGTITVSVVLMFASMGTMLFHRVAVFEEQGFDVGFVAALAGVSGLMTFPGRYLAPLIAHRIKPTTVFDVSVIGLVGSMGLAIVGSPAAVMVAHFVFFGLFFGFSLPMRAVIMNDWYSGPGFGSVMGKQWSIAAVVGGLTPWAIGAARDALGSYTIPLIVLTIAVALAGVFNELAARNHAEHFQDSVTTGGEEGPRSPRSSSSR
jgi:predicted MFS family arabinose efflux permease